MFDDAQDDSSNSDPQQLHKGLHLLTGGRCHHASTPTVDDEAKQDSNEGNQERLHGGTNLLSGERQQRCSERRL